MVDLMCSNFTFFSKETRKFMARWTFWTRSSSAAPTWPTATDRQSTFKIDTVETSFNAQQAIDKDINNNNFKKIHTFSKSWVLYVYIAWQVNFQRLPVDTDSTDWTVTELSKHGTTFPLRIFTLNSSFDHLTTPSESVRWTHT